MSGTGFPPVVEGSPFFFDENNFEGRLMISYYFSSFGRLEAFFDIFSPIFWIFCKVSSHSDEFGLIFGSDCCVCFLFLRFSCDPSILSSLPCLSFAMLFRSNLISLCGISLEA